jgi:hypothetical protein
MSREASARLHHLTEPTPQEILDELPEPLPPFYMQTVPIWVDKRLRHEN